MLPGVIVVLILSAVRGRRRGTFVGLKYGPFNDIPAVWKQYFASRTYKALPVGIAGVRSLTCSSLKHSYIVR
jgi:hypothetical protein